mmetsp:Transcript_7819/g.11555  ORF Transcript_7819/g.11555 Transcript_7819/m.11555 type:complete len:651 (-) Transcript_7819:381-2333(-)|eukprot:CAMPEP_0196817832 /NCGR_PEP_ID=MMETSP1362-20130617/62762_1 /TAXON_ID=163516 /ORGANISM="Leptocylindrus danicus, Strain CCMP1856" /LENGTH=650 /DNA_ID=CAMNT_0042195691 /DNA_START=147 /DNA_END=2099 /DNA_ORIENTATION=+
MPTITDIDRQNGSSIKTPYPDEGSDYSGPTPGSRKLTDPMLAALLIGCWIGFCFITYYAFTEGDWNQILHGADYRGRVCGHDKDDEGVVLPDHWYPVDIAGAGKCIEECPETTSYAEEDLICKDRADILELLPGCIDPSTGEVSTDPDRLIVCGACMYQLATIDLPLLYYCVPDEPFDTEDYINELAQSMGLTDDGEPLEIGDYAYAYTMRVAEQIVNSWDTIVQVGIIGSAVLGLIFLVTIRIPMMLACAVWISTISVPFVLFGFSWWAFETAEEWDNDPDEQYETREYNGLRVIGFFLGLFCLLSICLICFLRQRIQISIQVAKAAARAVMDVPITAAYPIIQLIALCGFLALWIPVMLMLATTGEPALKTTEFYGFQITYVFVTYGANTGYLLWFNLFLLFWTAEFIFAIGNITLAFCFCRWYFSVDKMELEGISLGTAISTAIGKHFGTAAFGALIVSALQLLRFVLLRIQEKMNSTRTDTTITDVAFACCQCFIFVLERWLKFLSRNAYIYTALFGYSYCRGSREAYYLIHRHFYLMGISGIISDSALFMGKVFVVLGCAMITYIILDENFDDDLYSALGATIGTGLVSFFVISIFIDVLGTAMDTVLICFLADQEMFGESGSEYVPIELRNFIETVEDLKKKED